MPGKRNSMDSRKRHGAQEWRENHLRGTVRVGATEREIKSDQRPFNLGSTVGFCYTAASMK